MKREEKEAQVKDLKQVFDENESFYLVNFMNMSVSQAVELRKRFKQQSYSFKVIKNRLALRALHEDFPEDFKNYLQGPTALAWASQNPIGLARLIKDFSDQHKVLTVKGGLLEGQIFGGEQFEEIASLNSRDELLSKMAYMLAFPLIKLTRTWQAPLSSLGRLLSQLKSKK
ncbi:MAG: 50S ribosomal protein L10 [Candidatus Aminicenantes bacterium]